MADLGVDASVFERAAALLARPLSPTALEKEQLQKGRSQPSERPRPAASPQRTAPKAKPKAKSQPVACDSPAPSQQPASETGIAAGGGTSAAASPHRGNSAAASPHGSEAAARIATPGEPSASNVTEGGSILAAVAELGGLQKGWKERLHSPSFRKAPVPRAPRQQKVLTEEERHDKLDEIDALEQQLQEAKAKASAVTAAANAAADFVSAEAARRGLGIDELGVDGEVPGEDGGKEKTEACRQAEERVKARKLQQAQERRDRERRESGARQAKQREAEEKAKALQRATKERMQSRLREEKERQDREREEAEKLRQERELRAADAEELRLQAAKRVAEREQAERLKAHEAAELEARLQRQQEEEAEFRALEGRERTKIRMLHLSQEQRAQQLAAEEERRRQLQVEAEAAAEQQVQAQLSQQRARARAAEFRQRSRLEEEERARLEAEEHAMEQAHAQAALLERQRKRHSRLADPVLTQPATSMPSPGYASGQPSPAGSGAGVDMLPCREASPEPMPIQEVSVKQAVNRVKEVHEKGRQPDHPISKAVPSRAPRTELAAKSAARAPPLLPADRAARQPAKSGGEAQLQSHARAKPKRQSPSAKAERADGDMFIDAPTRQSRTVAATVTGGGDDEPIRCTVGFFGVSDVDYLCDEDEEADDHCDPAAAPPAVASAAPRAPVRSHSRDSYSSRHSTPEPVQPTPTTAIAAEVPPATRVVSRAYSQPPPSRPPALPYGRAESPVGRGNMPGGGCASPGVASNNSDPPAGRPAKAQQQPWKQKTIQVKPADYYLDLLKAARGVGNKAPSVSKGKPGAPFQKACAGEAWSDAAVGYAEQMRVRASVVEATQKQEESAKYERGYAALQRVQQRALQVPSRSASTDSAPAQLISA